MIRTYRDLQRIPTFEGRFEYLKIGGAVGADTFGFDRYLNQAFYRSTLWRNARNAVIARDYGRDLGIEGYEIHDRILVHHMNPINPDDIKGSNLDIIDPNFLISVSHATHNAIHYGNAQALSRRELIERRPNDTKLW